ncbi:MAG: type II secretion system F family protein [Firmicutes bacterium]|nr:type II secretion system F family protein [Alicyclobacillaceae bacterium]MCL6497841.1 type II secretion system F family protein [Bacillota bacterium]
MHAWDVPLTWAAAGWWAFAFVLVALTWHRRREARRRTARLQRMVGPRAPKPAPPLIRVAGTRWRLLPAKYRYVVPPMLGALVAAAAWHRLWAAGAGLGAGLALPSLLTRWHRARRRRDLLRALPGFLETLAGGLRAGATARQVFRIYAQEQSGLLAALVADALSREELGLGLDAVFTDLGRRESLPALRWLGTAMAVQRQTGGSLARLVDAVREALHNQETLQREVRALTAQGRASLAVLSALIPLVAATVGFLDPGYLKPLATTPTGHLLVGYAAASMGVGLWLISRLVRRV